MDIPGLDDIGLQSLTLKLSMKSENEPDYFLIFEEYQNAFVWKKGLDTLLQMRNRGETVTTTIAFCCSSLDRINNDEMYSKMSIVDVDQASQWIECINSALPSIEKHIDRIRIFSEKCCILVCCYFPSFPLSMSHDSERKMIKYHLFAVNQCLSGFVETFVPFAEDECVK